MKTLKTLTAAVLVLVSIASLAGCAFAAEPNYDNAKSPDVRVNGYLVSFPDAKPFIDENDRTLMPVRAVTESLGATVEWDAATKTATVAKDGITVAIPIDSSKITVNKNGTTETVQMDTKAIIYKDRTCLPIRFVAEALEAFVSYSPLYDTVQITKGGGLTNEDITRLQGYYDMSHVEIKKACNRYDKEIALGFNVVDDPAVVAKFSGEYGFWNANEDCFRVPDPYGKTFVGYETGETYLSKTDAQRLANAFVTDAERVIYEMIAYGNQGKVTVEFKTNEACVYTSKFIDAKNIRGVLTLSFAKDFDVNRVIPSYETNAFPFIPTPGQTYTFDAEIAMEYSYYLWISRLTNLETRNVVKIY